MKIARIYLVLMVALSFAWGAQISAEMWLIWPDGDFSKEVGFGYFLVPLVILIFLWCRADAKARDVRLPLAEAIIDPLLFPIGVPYYFFRTYSLRRALVRVAQAVLFAALCVGAMWLGARSMHQYYAVWSNTPAQP